MVGSLINAFASMYKAKKAQNDEYAAHDRLLQLDRERLQYNAASLAAQSVNPLYDANIALYANGAKSSLLPGQALMQNQVDNNSSNAVLQAQRNGANPSQFTALLSAALGQQNQAATNMGIEGAQYRLGMQDRLAGANTAKAEEQDKAWNQNVWEPYNEQKNREYMQWLDAANRKEQWKAQQQQAGAQAGQDAGNFFKSYFTRGIGGSGGGNTQQSVNFRPQSEESLMGSQESEGGPRDYQNLG